MITRAVFLFLLLPAAASSEEVDCNKAFSTNEINRCAAIRVEKAKTQMEAYLQKARERYAAQETVLTGIEMSQEAWSAYSRAHCDSVYEIWRDGSIRGLMRNGCMLASTKQRTHEIWRSYLDSHGTTFPQVPEPN